MTKHLYIGVVTYRKDECAEVYPVLAYSMPSSDGVLKSYDEEPIRDDDCDSICIIEGPYFLESGYSMSIPHVRE